MRQKSFVRNLLVFAASLLIGALFNLPFGWGEVLDFVTDMVIFTVITIAVSDVAWKMAKQKNEIVWQYWAGIAGVLVTDFLFLVASRTTTFSAMWLWLSVTAFVGLLTGCWFAFVYPRVLESGDIVSTETVGEGE